MLTVENIKLYKISEAVEILKNDYNHKTISQNLTTKIISLNAFVMYKGKRYIPEDVIRYLFKNLNSKFEKEKTVKDINNKMEPIRETIEKYEAEIQQEDKQNFNLLIAFQKSIEKSIGKKLKRNMQDIIRNKTIEKNENLKKKFKEELKEELVEDLNQEIKEAIKILDKTIEEVLKKETRKFLRYEIKKRNEEYTYFLSFIKENLRKMIS
ncbi:hypothetical protein F0310_04655 (plasmid) [Borrelia sp. A-FGy1]|uniref:hypothetical protein n=1 Tax=Borrelia sp. A-FGy1 TaxID=2608247 RepID=UPI0015F35AFA|nr:hypothetical protein [Borrelia sp. A-FGy1]QMU99708.1 hypothetical protein F0310_04655 [Borrelia sp. A-FGy1]